MSTNQKTLASVGVWEGDGPGRDDCMDNIPKDMQAQHTVIVKVTEAPFVPVSVHCQIHWSPFYCSSL